MLIELHVVLDLPDLEPGQVTEAGAARLNSTGRSEMNGASLPARSKASYAWRCRVAAFVIARLRSDALSFWLFFFGVVFVLVPRRNWPCRRWPGMEAAGQRRHGTEGKNRAGGSGPPNARSTIAVASGPWTW